MLFILRLQAEITVKSRSLRQRHGKALAGNVRTLVKAIAEQSRVRWQWDHIAVETSDHPQVAAQVRERLVTIPGIAHIEEVVQFPLGTFDDVLEQLLVHRAADLQGKSFAVRVRRRGTHEFTSQQLAAYLGGGILERVEGTRVDLRRPEVNVQLWVQDDMLSIEVQRLRGLGGFPIPTQETVLSLISGGFDSAVASFQLIRRGARTHFCFFNLGGAEAHEVAVREITYYLWEKYSRSHVVKFVSVDFSKVVDAILTQDEPGVMGVVLKRAMMRAASQVAQNLKAQAIITGEAIGQVSSQTLSNLQLIDEVTPTLVLRPLVTMDKQQIVDIARDIGVEDMAAAVPEYCGVISNKPNVKCRREVVAQAEVTVTDALINEAVTSARYVDSRDLHVDVLPAAPEVVSGANGLPAHAVVLDIRDDSEAESMPLTDMPVPVHHVPFFRLARFAQSLDPEGYYALYCRQGVMSRLQAIALREQGFKRVVVLTTDAEE
ncbi:MAG: tRNA 4-thiouridine(8) synthase ThiI [Idiomarina sp.]|nr:tRNA 4-thiouridine(8) synthase ThiI [Idiomarina sp.]